MYRSSKEWKLAIRLDVTSMYSSLEQLQKMLDKTGDLCDNEKIFSKNKEFCDSFSGELRHREFNKVSTLVRKIKMIVGTPTRSRRGLVNAVGSVAKVLFGTMDAEDEKVISEQLQLIGNDVENIIERNENRLREAVVRITQKVDDYAQQQELRDYFLELGSLLTEMELDAEGIIIEYVTNVHTNFAKLEIVPLEQILHSLKEANNQFMQDLRFPFAVTLENWLEIKRFVTVSVYCKDSNIFTVVKFPLINSGSYNVYRVVPLPVHERDNVFAVVQVNHSVVAIDTNCQTYAILSETQWNSCGAPCELQMFINEDGSYENCEIDHMVSNQTVWVRLTKARVWLFSTLREETLRITCENESERMEVITGVGEIELPEQCELTTASIIVRTNQVVKGVGI
ncbi:uncharacterized protein LOC109862274, partial [Pseudomyrmex gracilis]|uniref:uncharacterized protein LOC109862274 n=1 Tax=Pseudomyrmex gracilis TaxID=219809 RepID=UPI000994F4EE